MQSNGTIYFFIFYTGCRKKVETRKKYVFWGTLSDNFVTRFNMSTTNIRPPQCVHFSCINFITKKKLPPPQKKKKRHSRSTVHGGSLKSTFKIPLISWVNPPFVSIPAESASFFQPFSLQILSPDEVSSKILTYLFI